MRLMWSSSSSVTGSWLNCSNNLLFTIFRIDPSILHMDMHSSVTLPQGLSTPVLSARKTRAVSPCFSIWTTFRTAPDGANICSDAKVRLLFLWIVAVRGLVSGTHSFDARRQLEIGQLIAVLESRTSLGKVTSPDCSDLNVGEKMPKGSASKSCMDAWRSWTACSSFFTLTGLHSTCYIWRCWHLRFCCTTTFILAMFFCIHCCCKQLLLCKICIHPSLSFEFRFTVVSVQRSSDWQMWCSPVIDWTKWLLMEVISSLGSVENIAQIVWKSPPIIIAVICH